MKKTILSLVLLSGLNALGMDPDTRTPVLANINFLDAKNAHLLTQLIQKPISSATLGITDIKDISHRMPIIQNQEWIDRVASCPAAVLLELIHKNPELVNDMAVRTRFLNFETKEKHLFTPEELEYIKAKAERVRHNYDWEVTHEWSSKEGKYGYVIENTGLGSSSNPNETVYIKAAVTSNNQLFSDEYLSEQLALVPYHKYGPMPTGSSKERGAAIASRANRYYEEQGNPYRIYLSEESDGTSLFTFDISRRATPAPVSLQGPRDVKIDTHNDTDKTKASSPSRSITLATENSVPSTVTFGNLSSIDQLFSSQKDIAKFPLIKGSSKEVVIDPALSAAADQRALELKKEAIKRANDHAQAIAFSASRSSVIAETRAHTHNTRPSGLPNAPERLAETARIASAIQRGVDKRTKELGGHKYTTELSGLPNQWEQAIDRLTDDQFIDHYRTTPEIREYRDFKERMLRIISSADVGVLKRLINDKLDHATLLENFDLISDTACKLGISDFFDSHITAMHKRIAGESWFTLNPIQAIDEKDQPALKQCFQQIEKRKEALGKAEAIIKKVTKQKTSDKKSASRVSSNEQIDLIKMTRKYHADKAFNRSLTDKGHLKEFYDLAADAGTKKLKEFVATHGSEKSLSFRMQLEKFNRIVKNRIDIQSPEYGKLIELSNQEALELTGYDYTQLRELSKTHEIPLEQLAKKFTDPLQQNLHKAIIKNINDIPTDYNYIASANALARAALKLNKNNQVGKAETLSDYLLSLGLTLSENINVEHALSLLEKVSKVIEIITDTTLDLTDVLFGYFQHGERFLVDKYASAERIPLLADGKRHVGNKLVEIHTGVYKAIRSTTHGIGYSAAKLFRDPVGLSKDIAYGAAEGMHKGICTAAEFIHNEGMHGVAIDNDHVFPEWSQAIIKEYFEKKNTLYGVSMVAAEMTAEEWGSTLGHALIAHYGSKFAHRKLQPIFRKIRSAAMASKTSKTLGEFTTQFKAKLNTRLDRLFPERISNGINEAMAATIAKTDGIYGKVLTEAEIAGLNLRDRKKVYISSARAAIAEKELIIPHDKSILPQIVDKRIDKLALLVDNPEMIIESATALARNTKKINNLKIMLQHIPGFSDKPMRLIFDLDHTFLIECDTRKVTGKAINIKGGHWTAKGELNRIDCVPDPCRPKILKPKSECAGYKLAHLEIDGIAMEKSLFPDHFDIDMASDVIIEAAQNLSYNDIRFTRNGDLVISGITHDEHVIDFCISKHGHTRTQYPNIEKMIELANKGSNL